MFLVFWRRGYICGGFIPHPPQWQNFALERHPRKNLLSCLGENVNPQLDGYAWGISIKCKVRALLNKITSQTFDSISDQLILYADLSVSDVTGSILLLVIHIIIDNAKAGALVSGVYAKLCRKLMDNLSPNVQVGSTSYGQRELVPGSAFFREYLLRLCQVEFDRRWLAISSSQESTALHSKDLYTLAKTKRQRLNITCFEGELFMAGVAADTIVRRCVTMLLWNTVSPELLLETAIPEDAMIESACALLLSVGKELDHGATRQQMDGYFKRIKRIARKDIISPRTQFMLQVSASLRELETF